MIILECGFKMLINDRQDLSFDTKMIQFREEMAEKSTKIGVFGGIFQVKKVQKC
jgi:hypothetical protein